MSSYRPEYNDIPPPPPPLHMPPLPSGPPPPYDPYRDDGRRPPRSPERLRRHDFSFRNRESAPQYPRRRDSYRPFQQNGPRRRNNYNDGRNLNRPQRGAYGYGARGPRHATSERPLLSQKHLRDDDFEMLGVSDGAVKYMNPEDLSDSSEEEMDVSDSDREGGEICQVGLDGNADGTATEPPTKRLAIGAVEKGEGAEPRWSNPDPYYVLPPVDEALARKRKDPVKQIRKSRKMAEEKASEEKATREKNGEENTTVEKTVDVKATEVNQVAANDDFISFSIDDGNDVIKKDMSVSDEDSEEGGVAVLGPPAGPRHATAIRNGLDIPPEPQNILSEREHATDRGTAPTLNIGPASPPLPTQIILDTPNEADQASVPYEFVEISADPDPSLGNRKRTYDDGIKGSSKTLRKRGKGDTPSGSLLEDWIPDRGTNPTPWLKRSEYITSHPGFRLHKEMCEFYDFVRPQKYEQVVREELLRRLQAAVKREMPRCGVHCFGSFAAGLYLPNADMDVVILSDSYCARGEKAVCQTNTKMRKFGEFITRCGIAQPGSVEVIFGAKVPLVKFVDRITSIKIDMSFENDSGVIANKTFSAWKQEFPAMPVLVTIVKQFLMMRGLNEVMNGGIGGFSVTCLIISLLQNMPRVQTGELIPEEHLGELLIEFLDFYGNRFDISRTGIMMNPPGYFDKHAYNRPSLKGPVYQANKADRIAIMDPNVPDHDISGGSRNVLAIFERISRARSEILKAMKTPGRISLLDWMLGGNYETFVWHRNHLRKLYNERYAGATEVQVQALTEIDVGHIANQTASNGRKIRRRQRNSGYRGRKHKSSMPTEILVAQANKPPGFHVSSQVLRAARLREEYPDMQGVPDKVTKPMRNELLALYHAGENKGLPHLTEEERQSQVSRSKKLKDEYPSAVLMIPKLVDRPTYIELSALFTKEALAQAPPSSTLAAKSNSSSDDANAFSAAQDVTRAPPPPNIMKPQGGERRAEATRSPAGTSRSEPIAVD